MDTEMGPTLKVLGLEESGELAICDREANPL